MSKRFGRNQRRKLRIEINSLQDQLQIQTALVKQYMKNYQTASNELERAKEIAINMSVLFAPLEINSQFERENVEVPWHAKKYNFGEIGVFTPVELRRIRLPVLITHLDKHLPVPDKYEIIHLVVQYGDTHRWGYAITRQALMMMPRRMAIEEISQALAHQIHTELINE